nr:hypothetical protein [Tanacetum cinerariifolium]
MPPSLTPSGSNTMPSYATPSSNTSIGSKTMPSALTGTNKGKCLLISKKRGRPVKNSASSSRGGSRGGATSRGGSRGVYRDSFTGGSRGGASKRGRGSSKRGQDSNTIPFQGLRDEASDEEECAREFDHVVENKAKDKGMPEDVATRKQPMIKDVAAGKQLVIEDETLQGGADLPTKESTVKVNLKPTRSKKSKAAKF